MQLIDLAVHAALKMVICSVNPRNASKFLTRFHRFGYSMIVGVKDYL